TLHYRTQGAGPLLLILQGGSGDADGSDALVREMAEDFTAVTYDRRGLSRSPLDDPNLSMSIATHADDAHRLIASLSTEPAFVFGCSIGAVIGLELISKHAEQVRVLVAHDPPLVELLPEDEQAEAESIRLELETIRTTHGVGAAMSKFLR